MNASRAANRSLTSIYYPEYGFYSGKGVVRGRRGQQLKFALPLQGGKPFTNLRPLPEVWASAWWWDRLIAPLTNTSIRARQTQIT